MKTWLVNTNQNYKDYENIKLKDDLYFHYTNDLCVESVKTPNGGVFVILGNVTHCNKAYKKPFDVLCQESSEFFLKEKAFLGGKWAVIRDLKLYTDFSCLSPVFWNTKNILLSNTFELFLTINKSNRYNVVLLNHTI